MVWKESRLVFISSRETGGSEPLATASGTALLGALGGCSFEQPTAAVSKSSYKMCSLCASWRVFVESADPGKLLPDFEEFWHWSLLILISKLSQNFFLSWMRTWDCRSITVWLYEVHFYSNLGRSFLMLLFLSSASKMRVYSHPGHLELDCFSFFLCNHRFFKLFFDSIESSSRSRPRVAFAFD